MNQQSYSFQIDQSFDNLSNQVSVKVSSKTSLLRYWSRFHKFVIDHKVYFMVSCLIMAFFLDRGTSKLATAGFSVMGSGVVYAVVYIRSILKMDFNFDLKDFK